VKTLESEDTLQMAPSRHYRLDFLDGIRGLAALFVVLHHIYFNAVVDFPPSHVLGALTYFLYLGRGAVDVFIVLSGYCLMLPIARSQTGKMAGGLREFFKRRARRILPPYYGALILSLVTIAFCPNLRTMPGTLWDGVYPAFTPSVVWSHLLLVQNLNPNWAHRVDYPMWSVASEWQIYGVFALVLLPVHRRFGIIWATATAFAISFILRVLFPVALSAASPHFIGLFALGMAGADLSFSGDSRQTRFYQNLNWGILAALFCVPLCAPRGLFSHLPFEASLWKDLFMGLATLCLLLFCTRIMTGARREKPPILLNALQGRFALSLGAFSYSMYLIHAPIIALVQAFVRRLAMPSTLSLAVDFLVAIPVVLGASYVFSQVFERPFLKARTRIPDGLALSAGKRADL
jgi:peptidoglycan/LPS O-acetylase OafA/YrhL